MRYRTVLRPAAGDQPKRILVYVGDHLVRTVPFEAVELANVPDKHAAAVRLASGANRVTQVGETADGWEYEVTLRTRRGRE